MDVGFIGLGHMGAPMARNLLRAGHRLTRAATHCQENAERVGHLSPKRGETRALFSVCQLHARSQSRRPHPDSARATGTPARA
jgi:hypothetical protein